MKLGPQWMPSWARRLQLLAFVGFIPWFALIMFGDPWERPYVTMGIFGLILVPTAVRAFFMLHAVGRGDITPFGTRTRHSTED
jgi:hypothetical protein